MAGSITSANSQIMLSVIPVFPVAQQMHGYVAEDIFDTDDVDLAEIQLGLDGKQSSGWVPHNVKWRITLMANSPSVSFFDTLIAAQDAIQDTFSLSGVVKLPGPGRKFAMNNGTLTRGKIMPDGKKTLQPQTYEITWESVHPAPV